MYDISVLRKMNAKAAKKTKGKQPYIAKQDGDANVVKCPNFGDYRPAGWRLKQELFVDNSGFGRSDEPALTVQQFIAKVKKGRGYAVTDEGQFQVHIGEFVKE